MPKCPCGKSFHACSSCGLNNSWEYEYCCHDHWKQYSKEYVYWKDLFISLYTSINSGQKMALVNLLTEMDSDYVNEIYDWGIEANENV